MRRMISGIHLFHRFISGISRSGYIERIDPGLVADWNRVYPDLEIQPNDRIVAVNGVEDLALMPAVIKESDKITLLIERAPPDWQVELEPAKDLGLVWDQSTGIVEEVRFHCTTEDAIWIKESISHIHLSHLI